MPGPGRGPGGHGRPMQKPKNAKKTIARLVKYLASYKLLFVFVFMCIIVSSGANVASSYFLQPVLNDYIIPMIGKKSPDLSGFISLLCMMFCIFVAGAFAGWVNSRIMLHISSKTLYRIRTELFDHLETRPPTRTEPLKVS